MVTHLVYKQNGKEELGTYIPAGDLDMFKETPKTQTHEILKYLWPCPTYPQYWCHTQVADISQYPRKKWVIWGRLSSSLHSDFFEISFLSFWRTKNLMNHCQYHIIQANPGLASTILAERMDYRLTNILGGEVIFGRIHRKLWRNRKVPLEWPHRYKCAQ